MRFKSLVIDNAEDEYGMAINTFYYIAYVLIFTFILVVIFLASIFFAFRVKNPICFIPIVSLFWPQNILYTYFASPTNLMNGVYNSILSILFLFLFKYTRILLVTKRRL